MLPHSWCEFVVVFFSVLLRSVPAIARERGCFGPGSQVSTAAPGVSANVFDLHRPCVAPVLLHRWPSPASKFVYACRLYTEELMESEDPPIVRLVFAQVSCRAVCLFKSSGSRSLVRCVCVVLTGTVLRHVPRVALDGRRGARCVRQTGDNEIWPLQPEEVL